METNGPSTPNPVQQLGNQKLKKQYFVGALLVLFLAVGLTGGYFFKSLQTTTPPTNNAAVESTPTPTIEEALPDIRNVEPVNKDQFEVMTKRNNDDCPVYPGSTMYMDNKTNSLMVSNSPSSAYSEETNAQFLTVIEYLQGDKKIKRGEDISPLFETLKFGCSGAFEHLVREIPGIKLDGADITKAFMTLSGQDFMGEIRIHVVAQVGDTFLSLSSLEPDDDPRLALKRDNCFDPESDEKSNKCFNDIVFSDSKLEEAAVKRAKELVALFRIQ